MTTNLERLRKHLEDGSFAAKLVDAVRTAPAGSVVADVLRKAVRAELEIPREEDGAGTDKGT